MATTAIGGMTGSTRLASLGTPCFSSTPQATGTSTTCSTLISSNQPSTGTYWLARSSVSRGVSTTAAMVLMLVITTDKATSPLAISVTTLLAVPPRTAAYKDQTDSQGCRQLQQHGNRSSQAGHHQKLGRHPQDHSSRLSADPQEVSRCQAQAHPQHDHPQADGDQWSTKPDEQGRVQQRQQRSQQRPERKQRGGESLEGHHRPTKHPS